VSSYRSVASMALGLRKYDKSFKYSKSSIPMNSTELKTVRVLRKMSLAVESAGSAQILL
jgi:hypothetical protein